MNKKDNRDQIDASLKMLQDIKDSSEPVDIQGKEFVVVEVKNDADHHHYNVAINILGVGEFGFEDESNARDFVKENNLKWKKDYKKDPEQLYRLMQKAANKGIKGSTEQMEWALQQQG